VLLLAVVPAPPPVEDEVLPAPPPPPVEDEVLPAPPPPLEEDDAVAPPAPPPPAPGHPPSGSGDGIHVPASSSSQSFKWRPAQFSYWLKQACLQRHETHDLPPGSARHSPKQLSFAQRTDSVAQDAQFTETSLFVFFSMQSVVHPPASGSVTQLMPHDPAMLATVSLPGQ
jgi:hypothetical protein